MGPQGPSGSATACPGPGALAAFASGRLSAPDCERIVRHLSSCPACEAALRALPDDRVTVLLRGARPVAADPELRRLEDFARGRSPRPGEPTVPDPATPSCNDRGGDVAVPRDFGPYELLGEPFYGGMGEVWKARHKTLDTVRALKMLPAGSAPDAQAVARFRAEGKATARLDHPHIIRLYEFDRHRGRLYYTMEFLEGGTLAGRLQAGPLPEAEAAGLLVRLARAAEHAHAQGVVHRDLKPSNVLFAADGTAKIADFGLAKILDEEGLAGTQTVAALGTPAYMSPEQAAGRAREATPAMDIWGLGVLLYECLTGQLAFPGHSRSETMELVRRALPELPTRLCPRLDRRLEAICLKCLEKDPARRYPSAAALAEDLERWLQGERPLAPVAGPLGRLARVVRRHPARAAAVALAVLLLLAAPAAYYLLHPDRAEWHSEASLARGEAVTLIPATGAPAWSEVILQKDKATLSRDRDGTFSLSSPGESFLELLRDPRQGRYRFRAEVHHLPGVEWGRAGLYFLRGGEGIPGGAVHWLYRLTFSDIPAKPAKDAPGQQRAEHRVFVEPCLCGEEGPVLRMSGSFREYGRATFEPRGGLWRMLEVRVTPELVEVRWQGEQIATISADEMARDAREIQRTLRGTAPFISRPGPPAVMFQPRAALGLCVMNGSAAFRNVAVEPLAGGP
jgi:serine/threonine-protein kinase